MRAGARFMVPTQPTSMFLPVGGIVGRSTYATLHVDDPRVSEAHALLSLRGGRLRLLALRRRFAVDGQTHDDLALIEGQLVELAPGLSLEVLALELPSHLAMIEGDGIPRQLLPDAAFIRTDPPTLSASFLADADGVVWSSTDRLRLRLADGAESDLAPGLPFELAGRRLQIDLVPIDELREVATVPIHEAGSVQVAVDDERVTISLGERRVSFDGVPARFLSVLHRTGGALDWATLSSRVWTDEHDWGALRRRLDVTLARIRKRLRESGLSPTIVRSDGQGSFALVDG